MPRSTVRPALRVRRWARSRSRPRSDRPRCGCRRLTRCRGPTHRHVRRALRRCVSRCPCLRAAVVRPGAVAVELLFHQRRHQVHDRRGGAERAAHTPPRVPTVHRPVMTAVVALLRRAANAPAVTDGSKGVDVGRIEPRVGGISGRCRWRRRARRSQSRARRRRSRFGARGRGRPRARRGAARPAGRRTTPADG